MRRGLEALGGGAVVAAILGLQPAAIKKEGREVVGRPFAHRHALLRRERDAELIDQLEDDLLLDVEQLGQAVGALTGRRDLRVTGADHGRLDREALARVGAELSLHHAGGAYQAAGARAGRRVDAPAFRQAHLIEQRLHAVALDQVQ